MRLLHKKPHVHCVSQHREVQGFTYWYMPPRDFDNLFAGENVVKIDGKISASLQYAGEYVIVIREETK